MQFHHLCVSEAVATHRAFSALLATVKLSAVLSLTEKLVSLAQ